MQRFEGHFAGYDNTELFFQTWSKEAPQGTVIITHGLAEHSECYHPLAKVLAENGWYVMGWDMRGHGRSEGKRGYVRDFNDFQKDLEAFIRLARRDPKVSEAPLVLFGHSMGGMVTLQHLVKSSDPQPDAAVFSSPCLGLTLAVPQLKELAAGFLEKWFPTLTLGNEIKYTDLSRDPQMLAAYPRDTLRHDKVSPGLFLGMQRAFEDMKDKAEKIQIPILFQLAGDDRLVSAQASREFFAKLPNKKSQLHIYSESLHEIFNDLDRETAIADLKKFLGTFKRAAS